MPHDALISIVITTYNRSDALLAVLRGLCAQTDKNFEVVIADDGSKSEHVQQILGSAEANQLAKTGFTHVWHPDVGFTASRIRNRGVAAAKGEYIILLDGDCVPEQDFVECHRLLAAAGYFVNGSRVLLSQEMTREVLATNMQLAGRGAMFWISRRLSGDASKLTGLIRLPDWSSRCKKGAILKGIRSCNLAIWRSDYEKVDGFDESFVGWGHEDADFVLRLYHSGVKRKNGFCATEVFHLWHKEAARNNESANARTVRERQQTQIVRATSGYSQDRPDDDGVITRLG